MRKKRLKPMRRPQDVPLDEIVEAMETSGKWVTRKLKGNPKTGPFSEAALTEKAALFFPKLAYMKWATGEWKWKEGLSLTTQFIRIIRSDMSHRLRDRLHNEEPDAMGTLSDDATALEAAQALAEELEMEEEVKDLGYQLVLKWLEEQPELVTYVKLVKELGDYRAISKRLRITIVEVRALEAETLKAIAAARKNQEKEKDL